MAVVPLTLRKVSISSLAISNPRRRTSVNIVPNAYPATRVSASRPAGDSNPIEFVQVRGSDPLASCLPVPAANRMPR